MFLACGIWCVADVSSVSPSSEQTVCLSVCLCLYYFVSVSVSVFLSVCLCLPTGSIKTLYLLIAATPPARTKQNNKLKSFKNKVARAQHYMRCCTDEQLPRNKFNISMILCSIQTKFFDLSSPLGMFLA